jgi:RsiW-degrading membrane proteinase PrsW (M82 family)
MKIDPAILNPHRPHITEKLFFLFSGAIMSTPFPAMANTLINTFLVLNIDYQLAMTISIIIIAPILEEFAKAYPLFYRHGETERSLIILGFLTGLGFGIAEFLLYIFYYQAPIIYRLPLIFFHASTTTIVAAGIGKNRSLISYLLAVILHSLVNIFAIMSGGWTIGVFAVSIFSYILAWYLYKISSEKTIDFWICQTKGDKR